MSKIISLFKYFEMLNIDDRILPTLNDKELWLLVHIVKRLNADGTCWPSNETLLKDTKWKDARTLTKVKKNLQSKGIIKQEKRYKKTGEQTSNTYRILTDLIGVYKPANKLQTGGTFNAIPGVQKMQGRGVHSMQGAGVQKMHPKVLTNEVLTNEVLDTEKQTFLNFPIKQLKKKIGKKHFQILTEALENGSKGILNIMKGDGRLNILLDWLEYKKSVRKGYQTYQSLKVLINAKFENHSEQELKAACLDSIANNYAGIFPKKQNSNAKPKRNSAKIIDRSKYAKARANIGAIAAK